MNFKVLNLLLHCTLLAKMFLIHLFYSNGRTDFGRIFCALWVLLLLVVLVGTGGSGEGVCGTPDVGLNVCVT